MLASKIFIALSVVFLTPAIACAWGGPEHCSITTAAVSVLSPAVLAFLGGEAVRLIKVYCNYPDFNWAVYGTCSKGKDGNLRLPDKRRDFDAPHYCGFDEFTGEGNYYGHSPEIGKQMPSDEHSKTMNEKNNHSAAATSRACALAQKAFNEKDYYDAIRYIGVAVHYMEDSTPPPHALGIPGGQNTLHHDMEAVDDHSGIVIPGYVPRVLADTPEKIPEAAASLAETIALKARELAKEQVKFIEAGKNKEAKAKKYECANLAAKANADLINTFFELNKNNLPTVPANKKGVNLLFNPSFDKDKNNDLVPDGWIREWNDLKCPCDMHLWDRVSPRNGACVRIYGTSEAGAEWRTARAFAIPVKKGERYLLKGKMRPQCATGESCLALRFQNAEYETAAEYSSEKTSGGHEWKEFSVEGTAPENASDLLVACVSINNSGSVLFDDLSLELI